MKKNSKKYNKYCLMSAQSADIFYLIFTNKNKQKKGAKAPNCLELRIAGSMKKINYI